MHLDESSVQAGAVESDELVQVIVDAINRLDHSHARSRQQRSR